MEGWNMEGWNIVDILKIGLPGLVFLLAMLSYRLLSKEQEKPKPDPDILSSIRNFMCINVISAMVTLVSPMIDHVFFNKVQTFDIEAFDIEAKTANVERGKAAVCQNANYANKYLLIKDKKNLQLIQVFSSVLTPCNENQHIMINKQDASNLGWSSETNGGVVEVVTAPPGCKFETFQ